MKSPSERSGMFGPSAIAAMVVLATAAAGIIFHLGPNWHFFTNIVTALTVLFLAWEVGQQRKRSAERTAAQIEELLKLLRSAKAEFSRAEIQTIVAELERMQFDVLRRATLKR